MSPASIVIDKSPFLTPDTTNYHIMGLMDFSHGGLGLNQTGRGGLQAVSGDGTSDEGRCRGDSDGHNLVSACGSRK